MKRVQDYLKELDRERLIETYLKYASDDNKNLFNLSDYTEAQQKQWKYREIDKFIQCLIDMEIKEIEDGKTYILFAYPGRVISTEEMDVEYALICQDDLKEEQKTVVKHYFDTSSHSEIIGLYVANIPYTQRNIYDLMAMVLCVALAYGFHQEQIYEKYSEVENPFGIWYKDRDKYIDILQGICLESIPLEHTQPLDINQVKLWFEVLEARDKYKHYCFDRELSVLRNSLIFTEKCGNGLNPRTLCGVVKCKEDGQLFIDEIILQIQNVDINYGLKDIEELYISYLYEDAEVSQTLRSLEIYEKISKKISVEEPAYLSKEFLKEYFEVDEELPIEEGTEFVVYYETSNNDVYGCAARSYHITYLY